MVFTTTFYPVAGPAEEALCELMKKIPDAHFDIVTAAHAKGAHESECPVPNATVHRVGGGTKFDKFLLPLLGAKKGIELARTHQYLFCWSLMASYGAVAALAVRNKEKLPLLVTLADQQLGWYQKFFLRFLLGKADQVYASSSHQNKKLGSLAGRMQNQASLGAGDSFANQIRFVYAQVLSELLNKRK